ncbi:MAG: transcriptional repressor LexA [bacterium]|nr:transcriptional repressor LexA [bacterium]
MTSYDQSYLTERQRDVLRFVRDRIADHGFAPTLQEISNEFGFSSTASAQKHIAQLERKGFLRREKHQKRGLVLAAEVLSEINDSDLPLLGRVAAGAPIESFPGDESIAVPDGFAPGSRCFALVVSGDSMADEGVLDGDHIIVQERVSAVEGEMVVALVSGEVTLKRYFRESADTVRLQPSNVTMAPLRVPARDVTIQGVVIGLLRRYVS